MDTANLAAEPILDPTVTVLLTIFGGALVAAIAGFVGAAIQSRSEHRRWLHEARYEAFVRAYALIKSFDLNRTKTEKVAQRDGMTFDHPDIQGLLTQADALYASVGETLAPLVVLGPPGVGEHVVAMQDAYEAGDEDAQGEAERAFVHAARKALRIRR